MRENRGKINSDTRRFVRLELEGLRGSKELKKSEDFQEKKRELRKPRSMGGIKELRELGRLRWLKRSSNRKDLP